jgi:cytochrome c oxidase assembly factor 5
MRGSEWVYMSALALMNTRVAQHFEVTPKAHGASSKPDNAPKIFIPPQSQVRKQAESLKARSDSRSAFFGINGNETCPAEANRSNTQVLEMPAKTAGQCDTLLEALKTCLLRSDCVLKRGLLPSECLRDHYDELPEECRTLKATLVDCKKGMVSNSFNFSGVMECVC